MTPPKSLVRLLAARLTAAQARWLGDVAGLGCLTAAAWLWNIAAGLAALGVALLLLVARSDQT